MEYMPQIPGKEVPAVPACRLFDNAAYTRPCWPVVEACYSRTWTNYHMTPHCHQRAEIMYVLKGRCQVKIYTARTDDQTGEVRITYYEEKKLGVGEFIFIDAGVMHALDVPESSYMINAEFRIAEEARPVLTLSCLRESSADFRSWAESSRPWACAADASGALHGVLAAIVDDFAKIKGDERILQDMRMGQLLLAMAQALQAEQKIGVGYVRRAVLLLNERMEETIKVEDVARAVGVSATYLQKIFKQVQGMTMIEYLNRIRIERSKLLLACTDDPVVDIAIATGYNSRQHFARVFHGCVGVSPQQYRRDARDQQRRELFLFD